jgi:hypothetical protein
MGFVPGLAPPSSPNPHRGGRQRIEPGRDRGGWSGLAPETLGPAGYDGLTGGGRPHIGWGEALDIEERPIDPGVLDPVEPYEDDDLEAVDDVGTFGTGGTGGGAPLARAAAQPFPWLLVGGAALAIGAVVLLTRKKGTRRNGQRGR